MRGGGTINNSQPILGEVSKNFSAENNEGYLNLSNGFQLRWGIISLNMGGNVQKTYNFSQPFTTECMGVYLQQVLFITGGWEYNNSTGLMSMTNTSFSIKKGYSETTMWARYLAIGH